MSKFKLFVLSFFVFTGQIVFAKDCIPVDGLQFEAIDVYKLLIIRDGKNIGILTLYSNMSVGDLRKQKSLSIRFFTPIICDSGNREFHINGSLWIVDRINIF